VFATGPAAPVRLPAAPELFSARTLALLGTASHGRLAGPAGQVAETAAALLSRPPRKRVKHAAIRAALALALHTRWLRERAPADLAGAFAQVQSALTLLPPRQALAARMRELLAGMLLDRAQLHGDYADVRTALGILDDLCAGPAPADLNMLLAAGCPPSLAALIAPPAGPVAPSGRLYRCGLEAAIGSGLLLSTILPGTPPPGSPGRLCDAIDMLARVADDLPADDARLPAVRSDLGLACLAAGQPADGLRQLRAAVTDCPPGHPQRGAIVLRAAAALAGTATGAAVTTDAIALITEALQTAGLNIFGERSRCLYCLGYTLLVRFADKHDAADLRRAVAALEEARVGLEPIPGDPFTAPTLRALAWAYRELGAGAPGLDRRRSRSIGRSLLHAHGEAVLLQSGVPHSVAAARAASADALRLARWCLADGKAEDAIEALELGRALVLHAATVAADVPGLLHAAGRPGLAREWIAHADDDPGDITGDLRHQVLTALRSGPAEQRLLSAPPVSEIQLTLRALRMDGLAYLVPASADAEGRMVLVPGEGTPREHRLPALSAAPGSAIDEFAAAHREFRAAVEAQDEARTLGALRQNRQALEHLCDWAWDAAIGPLLDLMAVPGRPPRLALAPVGVLGIVPWHAARRGEHDYACARAVFTTCASARQLIEAARRPPGDRPAVLVASPAAGLRWPALEVDAIGSAFYPGAVRLGPPGTAGFDGPATPGEVLARWSASAQPAVCYLGCHAYAGDTPDLSRLELYGGDLAVSQILAKTRTRAPGSPGGLVILAACTSDLAVADHDETLTLTSAFLAAGAGGVIGARWEVPDVHTALLMFMLHRHLTEHPADGAAEALRAAQLWMLDRHRKVPAEMPAALAAQARRAGARHPYAWAAFTCHGH
jgi:CHAT domain